MSFALTMGPLVEANSIRQTAYRFGGTTEENLAKEHLDEEADQQRVPPAKLERDRF